MMKFLALFGSACLLAVVSGEFDFDRLNRLVRRGGNHANADCSVATYVVMAAACSIQTFSLFLLVCVATSVG